MQVRVGVVAAAPDVVHPHQVALPHRPVGRRHGGDLLGNGGDALVAQVPVEEVVAWGGGRKWGLGMGSGCQVRDVVNSS